MKIDMNKNFEEEFRVTFWKGLTAREVVTGALAFAASLGTAGLLWYFTGISFNLCVYAGLPVMLVIGGIGIYQYQGMSVMKLLKELQYMKGTKELAAETEEYREGTAVFTMGSGTEKKERKGR